MKVVTNLYGEKKNRFVNDQESCYLHKSEESTVITLCGHFLTSSRLMFIIHWSHCYLKISLVSNNVWKDEKGKMGLIF